MDSVDVGSVAPVLVGVIAGLLCGALTASIAGRKGYSRPFWFLMGFLLFALALPAALFVKPNEAGMGKELARQGLKKCPACAEVIKREAAKCRHCGTQLRRPRPATTELETG